MYRIFTFTCAITFTKSCSKEQEAFSHGNDLISVFEGGTGRHGNYYHTVFRCVQVSGGC